MRPLLICLLATFIFPSVATANHSTVGHIMVSEIQIAGVSATDEFIELYNPADCPMQLDGWKLTKKTASGTESNLVSSLSGAVPEHGYFLITPQTGYTGSTVADSRYSGASFSVAANNTVLLYSDQDKTILVDKVGFADSGVTVDAETVSTINPDAGNSIERADVQDSDNNAADFYATLAPTPQNSSVIHPAPATCVLPPAPPQPSPPQATPSPPPSPIVAGSTSMSIKAARALPNGEVVTVQGIVTAAPGQLSTTSFYIEEAGAGIQIYSSKKDFPQLSTGDKIEVKGELSESFKDKRIKITAANDVKKLGKSSVSPSSIQTSHVNESTEGRLVKISGSVTETSGSTFYVDDGSGEARIYIREETGIDKPRMAKGDQVTIIGIVSQYQETYRILPRTQSDIALVESEAIAESEEEFEEGIAGEQEEEFLESHADTGPVVFVPQTTRALSFQQKPKWEVIAGWSAIIGGSLLLALLPLLIWTKQRKSQQIVPKPNSFSSTLPRD